MSAQCALSLQTKSLFKVFKKVGMFKNHRPFACLKGWVLMFYFKELSIRLEVI